jgi:hypothetical protein
MALFPGSMVEGFTQLFTSGLPQTSQDSAQKMASIYHQYAQTATAGPALPLFTGLETDALQALLTAALAVPQVGAPSVIAAAWGSGLVSYWNTPPVLFAGVSVAGSVTVAAGCLSAIPVLTTLYLNAFNTPETAAAQMASALDIATRTVLVTLAPPPGTVVPLT